jgi:DNA-binding PadR family transcriptional regulator
MFGRHNHHHGGRHGGRAHGRHPFGFHGHDHHERGHHGRGGRMGRFFDHGDLRFVVLKLIAEKPSHGYELIKAVETAAGGAYTPSPGVIYPTLTLLEELGYITVGDAGGGKKLYTITDEGEAFLEATIPNRSRACSSAWPKPPPAAPPSRRRSCEPART